MATVYFGMEVLEFARSLLMLYSKRVKCGARDVFSVCFREVLLVGYF